MQQGGSFPSMSLMCDYEDVSIQIIAANKDQDSRAFSLNLETKLLNLVIDRRQQEYNVSTAETHLKALKITKKKPRYEI